MTEGDPPYSCLLRSVDRRGNIISLMKLSILSTDNIKVLILTTLLSNDCSILHIGCKGYFQTTWAVYGISRYYLHFIVHGFFIELYLIAHFEWMRSFALYLWNRKQVRPAGPWIIYFPLKSPKFYSSSLREYLSNLHNFIRICVL